MIVMPLPLLGQVNADRLTTQEEREMKLMLEAALKAKPGTQALQLSDPAIKRQFDLASRVAEYELLRINKGMVEKKFHFEGEFIGNYISRYPKLFDEKMKNDWLIAYAMHNKTEKAFFDKALEKTGLKGDKRNTIIVSHYHLLYPAERVYYMEIVGIVYKNGTADFSMLPKRAKDWVAERNEMFP